MPRMTSTFLRCAFLLAVLWDISDGRQFRRQAGVHQVQSRVVLVGNNGCNANGKDYKAGEEWTIGHLRYKCSEFGYNIVGCALASGKILKVNEDFVGNNTAYRCYRVGNGTRTYYQEFTCGVPGAMSCDLKPITQETENQALGGFLPINTAPVVIGQLPPGWKIVDDQGKPVEVLGAAKGASGGTQTIVSSAHIAAESGNAGSGMIMGGPASDMNKVGKIVPRAAEGSNTGTSGMTGMAGTRSSVTWDGKTKGGIGIGPGTFTIRSGPTGSSSSFVPAGASHPSG